MPRNPRDQPVGELSPSHLRLVADGDATQLESIFQQYASHDDRGMLVLNSRRDILYMNGAAREILGAQIELPVPLGQVIRDVKVTFAIGDAIHDRIVTEQEAFLPDPDQILRFRMVPIVSRGAGIDSLIVTVEEVTQLRHLETVRKDFVANVSHELRTPIASINLLVESLQNGALSNPEMCSHFLRRIGVETASMTQLVEELLQLSRLESGRLSLNLDAVSLAGIADRVVERLSAMADEKSIILRSEVNSELPPVRADYSALEQVLMNLSHNGIKFTPGGGEVTIRARRRGPSVEVEVYDTGMGIDEEDAARVFERFYKADKGRHRGNGTGLGLAIVRHVLELHGSRLSVVSEPDRGSRFTFALSIDE